MITISELRNLEYEGRLALVPNADLSYQSAEDWYDDLDYPWSVADLAATNDDDVLVRAILAREQGRDPQDVVLDNDNDDDDDEDDDSAAQLYADHIAALREQVDYARDAAVAADAAEAYLQDTVAAYQRGDLPGVVEALISASGVEMEYGDDPAASHLMHQLLVEVDDDEDF